MKVSRETWEARRLQAHRLARAAGDLIRSAWDGDVQVTLKGEVDLVTEVDHASEALIVDGLRAAFPDDGIVAEEGSGVPGHADATWYVDPLDGTTNFSHGLPHFAVSIACWDAAGPRLAVVYDPIRRWAFHAERGTGAWLDGRRLKTSAPAGLASALVATGFPANRRSAADNNLIEVAHMLRHARGLRRAGSAALDLAFVAAGWLDGFWEARLSPWDVAAGALLVTEAGGLVSLPSGAPFQLADGGILASGAGLHAELVTNLNAARAAAGLTKAQ
jgi:myo-inositol-1(or 4)-monophosphatase